MKKERKIFIIFFIILLFFIGIIFIFDKKEVVASSVILKDGNLYRVSDILGEKRLTTKEDIKLLFDQKSNKILFGKKWENETVESERIGGTRLWIMNDDGSNELAISNELIVYAFFDKTGKKIFYNTRNQDLYLVNIDGTDVIKLQEKTLTPDLSPDNNYLVYQKLNPDWEVGQYYDQALGITILDLISKKEKLIAHTWEDFAPMFTPNGKKILFFSRSPEGLASHFIMNTDGSNRKQLTNTGEKFVSDKTIPVISEKPIWSKNGRYLIYESDREIWVNEFDDSLDNIINAKQLSFGLNPQWFIDGEIITVVLTNTDKASESLIKVDLNGKVLDK